MMGVKRSQSVDFDLVAIDPGTEGSGVALFLGDQLVGLKTLDLPELAEFIRNHDVQFVIEDVEAIKTIYQRNQRNNTRMGLQVAQSVGLVKATGRHIIKFMVWEQRSFTKLKPTPGNWGTLKTEIGKAQLRQHLGWESASNKDTRSAAFFGFLFLRQQSLKAKRARAIA